MSPGPENVGQATPLQFFSAERRVASLRAAASLIAKASDESQCNLMDDHPDASVDQRKACSP